MRGNGNGLTSVPDPPGGVRWCTHCEDFIPLPKFPNGTRRYVCKMHMWNAIGKHSSKKCMSDPRKRALHQVWGRAYTDARFFEQPRIAITQAEINEILTCSVADGIDKDGVEGVAIVPADPTKTLSASNSAIVTTSTRRVLMKQWKKLGTAGYCKLLHGSNASGEL